MYKRQRALRADTNAYLMFNHGALCCGVSAGAAMLAVEDLETLARQHLMRLIAARAAQEPSMHKLLQRIALTLADGPKP